jgi:hypothetical protein
MNIAKGVRFLAAALLLISGVLHVYVGLSFIGTNTTALAVDVIFGVIYVIVGIGLYVGRRLFSYLGVIFPLIGGTGATYEVVTGQAPPAPISPLVAVAIDVAVILLCGYLLLRKERP